MSWFDFVIIGIVLISTYWSYSQGIILEITFFVGTIVGLLFSFLFYPTFTPFLASILGGEMLPATVSFVLIFAFTGVIFTIMGLFAQRFVGIMKLRWLDRLLGALVGLLKSVLGVCVLVVMISGMYPEEPPEYLEHSMLAQPVVSVTAGTMESMPAIFSDFMDDYGYPALESLEALRESDENQS